MSESHDFQEIKAISGKHYTRNLRRCMKILSVPIKKNLIYLHADQFREDFLLPFLTLLSNTTALTVILMFSNEKIRIIGSAMRNKWVRRVPSAGFGGVHWIDKYPKALSRWLRISGDTLVTDKFAADNPCDAI